MPIFLGRNQYRIFTLDSVYPITSDANNPPKGAAAIINPKTVYDIPTESAIGGKNGVIKDPHMDTNILVMVNVIKATIFFIYFNNSSLI